MGFIPAYDHGRPAEVSRQSYNAVMAISPPFNLRVWIDQNRPRLRPPVGNKLLFQDSELIVMAVGGPNFRKDYHHDPGEEFFYQLEGSMVLKTIQDGRVVDIPISAGDVLLLPANVPHSPRRLAGSVGIVVERRRAPEELDGFSWYCEQCGHCLYLTRVPVKNIETELPGVFERFYGDLNLRTCERCGTVMPAPGTS
jgi:3-hydroxyanthranilate 3,4-dioxygenase